MGRGFLLGCLTCALLAGSLQTAAARAWEVVSPDHRQTFAFGSERRREWLVRGNHLGLALDFTNEPYVNEDNPKRYDDFIFDFPSVTLGKDGRTFSYHPPQGQPVAVAVREPGFLGDEVKLLPTSFLVVRKPHGLVSLTLVVTAPGGLAWGK